MTERILPEPDIFATCPLDGNILQYYASTFEAVYVSLHPFIRAISVEKEKFNSGTYPNRTNIMKNCEPVTWAEVAQRTNLPSLASVDIGLRTLIRGLKEELQNLDYADKIEALYETESILTPPEGFFLICFTTAFFTRFKALGINGSGSVTSFVPKESCTG